MKSMERPLLQQGDFAKICKRCCRNCKQAACVEVIRCSAYVRLPKQEKIVLAACR